MFTTYVFSATWTYAAANWRGGGSPAERDREGRRCGGGDRGGGRRMETATAGGARDSQGESAQVGAARAGHVTGGSQQRGQGQTSGRTARA